VSNFKLSNNGIGASVYCEFSGQPWIFGTAVKY